MDLAYQSQRNVDITKQLNRLDKLTSKLAFTVKQLPEDIISIKLKDKIITYVSNDHAKELIRLLDKQVIVWNRQVGAKGTKWNVIHVCAKFNAVNCARALLKQLYQQDPEQYTHAVNAQTSEGFTPLMIAIIYRGDLVLQLLMRLGGVDLGIIQGGKLRAYDLALHYRNQYAISQLIVYQDKCRKQAFINEQELLIPQPILQQPPGLCQSIASYLIDCLICFKFEEDQNPKDHFFAKVSPLFQKQGTIDAVKVGSRRDIEDYEIQWKKLSTIQGQRVALFDSFKPQDISENQFSLKHNLILLQILSDYSWLLRKIITKVETPQGQPQKYLVHFYHHCLSKKIQVDQCVPIIKQRGEPMFLSNRCQLWPMILQKALAKVYGSYLSLNTLSPTEILETITGFYTKQIALQTFPKEQGIVATIQQLSSNGYLVLLKGRPRTDLNPGSQCSSYSILNYYEKGTTRKILVGCSNIVQKWKQCIDNRQLAIIKSHFSRHNQSCLWIDQQKIQYYFTHVIVNFVKDGYQRSDLKLKIKIKEQSDNKQSDNKIQKDVKRPTQYTKAVFFQFKVQKDRDQSVLLQLTNLQTRHRYDLSNLKGWKDQGSESLLCEKENFICPEIARIGSSPGQYLCKFQLKAQTSEIGKGTINKRQNQDEIVEGKKRVKLNIGPQHLHQLQLSAWASEAIQFQILQEQFGTIQWLSHYRTYAIKNWSQIGINDQKYATETVNGRTIYVTKCINQKKKANLFFAGGSFGAESVLQGKWSLQGENVGIEMLREGSCLYCVVANVNLQDQEVKLYFSQ